MTSTSMPARSMGGAVFALAVAFFSCWLDLSLTPGGVGWVLVIGAIVATVALVWALPNDWGIAGVLVIVVVQFLGLTFWAPPSAPQPMDASFIALAPIYLLVPLLVLAAVGVWVKARLAQRDAT